MKNFEIKQQYYCISDLDVHIGAKIKDNWGLNRIFQWLRGKEPYHGDSIILTHILFIAKRFNRQFKKRTISRIINRFEENLQGDVKRSILAI
jgi:hypothetical protein